MSNGIASSLCNVSDNCRRRAATNVDAALGLKRHLPENVFLGRWDAFYFFDSDFLFEPKFVEKTKTLLDGENGSCVCMRNLELKTTEQSQDQSSVFLDKEASGEAYMAYLRGPNVGSGWLYRMDSYGCSSDVGSWCIYCEKINEIAVIAIRNDGTLSGLQSAVDQLKAVPVIQVIESPTSYGISSRGLSPEWCDKLKREYANGVGQPHQ